MYTTKEEVRAAMLRKLKESALGNGDLEDLEFEPFTAAQVAAKPNLQISQPAAGFVIPYYDVHGTYSDFFRFRYLEQPVRTGFAAMAAQKELRYTQPAGLTPRVYFSPIFNWEDHFSRTQEKDRWLVITEGELKANCACKMGFPTLALGGVWNFMSKAENIPLIKDLADLPLKDYIIYIVYDSDAITNPEVLRAENVICQRMLDSVTRPYVVRLPALGKGKKTGLDDFLVAKGKAAFQKLLDNAEEYEASAALHALNEEVIFLRANNNILEPATRNRWRPKDFSQGVYAALTYTVSEPTGKKGEFKIKTLRTAEEWVKWPGRATVECVTYRPGAPLITDNQYNMWQGWGLTNGSVKAGNTSCWDKLMDYAFKDEDSAHRIWFEQWCAYPLQHPGVKMITAPVFWSVEQGTGKTLIAHTLARIYGENFSEIDASMLDSTHNEWAQYKQFVLGDEITGEELGGKRKVTIDTLKGLTTRQKLYLNPKYVGGYFIPDCINYFFTSNHPDAFRLEDRDRRFAIFEIKGAPLPEEFYRSYDKWYKSDAVGALFYKLLHLDLTGFNPYGAAPLTRAKRNMIDDSRSDLSGWVAALKGGELGDLIKEKRTLWTREELYEKYRAQGSPRVTAISLAKELKRQGFHQPLNGDPLRTEQGIRRLWFTGDDLQWKRLKQPKDFAKLFNEERAAEIAFKEKDEKANKVQSKVLANGNAPGKN